MSGAFKRGLSDELREDLLHGPCAMVLQAGMKAGLDVRLRDNYFNLYFVGRSVAKVMGRRRGFAKLEVSQAYLDCDQIGDFVGRGSGDYRVFDVDHAFAEAYAEALDGIMSRARRFIRREERVELRLLKSNDLRTAVCCFDRQIQVPGATGRLDVMAIRVGPRPALVAIEVKCNDDASIQEVPEQLHNYLEIFDPKGDGLRDDVAQSYRKVCEQLRALGLAAAEPSQIATGMPVEGLVVVSDYNPRSRLLSRAHELAQQLERTIYLLQATGGDLRIPERRRWVRMGEG